jgi:ribose transport system substrate-binding protein
MQAMSGATKATVETAGGEFITRDAGLDPNQQVTDLEHFISIGVDVIIVPLPPVMEAITPTLEKARESGIAIITHNVTMDYAKGDPVPPADAQIVEDRRTAAQQQVEYLSKQLPAGGKILYVGGPAPTPALLSSEEELTAAIKNTNFEISNVVNNMTDDIAGAKSLVDAALTADSDIVAVVGYNDPSAVGAAQAAQDAGRDLVVLGLQAQPEGTDAVSAGTINATWDLHVVESGILLGQLATQAARDENGWQQTYLTDVTRYDAENIAEFIPWDEQIAAIK